MNIRLVLVPVLGLALLTACGGGSGDIAPPAPEPIATLGKAQLSAPLVGANVEAQDRQGRILSVAVVPTDAGGTFKLPLGMAKGARIRVVVTGGTHAGMPFDGKLLLDVNDFNPDTHLLYVNAATTLIGRYLDAHPQASVDDASTRVKNFLRIPATSDAGANVDNPLQNYFRHEKLMAEAMAGGAGFDAYLESLIAELDRGVATHAFSRQPQLQGGAFDYIANLVLRLGKAIGTDIGSDTVSLLFEKFATAIGADGTAEILRELKEIQRKLDELSMLSHEILGAVKESQLEQASLQIQNDVTDIENLYKKMLLLGEQRPNREDLVIDREVEIQRLLTIVLEGQNGSTSVLLKLEHIDAALINRGGALHSGLLGFASGYLQTVRLFDPPVTDPKLTMLREYYQTVRGMGLQLVAEAYLGRRPILKKIATAQTDAEKAAEKAAEEKAAEKRLAVAREHVAQVLDTFRRNDTAQIDRVEELRVKTEGVVQDLRSKLFWLRAPFSNFERITSHGYYPSMFEQAEGLCQELAMSKFAGLSNWRLPSDPEFHALVKGSPNDSGNADGGAGRNNDGGNAIFAWLVQQGFDRAPDNFAKNQRGVLPTVQSAYFSGTRSGLNSHEALYDYGVDWASEVWSIFLQGPPNHPAAPGAWCVSSGTPAE